MSAPSQASKPASPDDTPLALVERLGAAFDSDIGPSVPGDLKCDITDAAAATELDRWVFSDTDNPEHLARAYTLLLKAARELAHGLKQATAPASIDPSAVTIEPPQAAAIAALVERHADRLPAFAAELERLCREHGIYIAPQSPGWPPFLSFWTTETLEQAYAAGRGPRVLVRVSETGAVLLERPLDGGNRRTT
ncbi:MAG: hypothetical protein IBJ15_00285 [Alphaproteobacteria bacterium]|nr:hypothetical protein [Alphaproteobacteria bacterium]